MPTRDEVFWCTADPGWVTGTSHGIIAPLAHGATVLVDAGEFEADRWYANLAGHRIEEEDYPQLATLASTPAFLRATQTRDGPG
ncbi:hypothetical protein ABT369_05015 [Dactylosporangium sp. NPDC000244]|uniref:hypothetical protein n=1 Tax=Dactylosporangium sp. NPDC000244 TaxID=3154365 RepID=UPI0033247025